jgi:DNA-binding CsgD family transcriptional regulator
MAYLIHDATEEKLWLDINEFLKKMMGATSVLYGFSHSAYAAQRAGLTKSAILFHNHPSAYIEAVGGDKFLDNDICAAAIINAETPYFWHFAVADPEATEAQRRQSLIDVEFNMHVGISLSLPFAKGRGVCGLGFCCAGLEPGALEGMWRLHGDIVLARVKAFDAIFRPIAVRNRLCLTPREKEILALSAGGLTAKAVAHQLGLQTKTIYNTLERSRLSLKAATTMEAVAKACVYGLI